MSRQLLKKLNSRHIAIARMLVIGYSTKEIVDELGITPQTIINCRCDPLFNAYLQGLQETVNSKQTDRIAEKGVSDPVKVAFANAKLNAANKIVSLIDSGEDDRIKLSAAQDILNREGYAPQEKGKNTGVNIIIDGATAKILKDALSE